MRSPLFLEGRSLLAARHCSAVQCSAQLAKYSCAVRIQQLDYRPATSQRDLSGVDPEDTSHRSHCAPRCRGSRSASTPCCRANCRNLTPYPRQLLPLTIGRQSGSGYFAPFSLAAAALSEIGLPRKPGLPQNPLQIGSICLGSLPSSLGFRGIRKCADLPLPGLRVARHPQFPAWGFHKLRRSL